MTMTGNVPDLSRLNQRVFGTVSPMGLIRKLNEDGAFELVRTETLPDGSLHGVVGRYQLMDAEDLIAAIRQEVHEELQAALLEIKRAVQFEVNAQAKATLQEMKALARELVAEVQMGPAMAKVEKKR